MKKLLLVWVALTTLALFGCFKSKDPYTVLWGVWNLGPEKAAIFNYHCDGQLYSRTPGFLSFEKGTKGRPKIVFDGGYYDIKRIRGQYPDFDLSLEREKDELIGNLPPAILRGHARVHFVSENKMWIETIQDSEADSDFDVSIGNGQNGPNSGYWRAVKLDKPLPTVE